MADKLVVLPSGIYVLAPYFTMNILLGTRALRGTQPHIARDGGNFGS